MNASGVSSNATVKLARVKSLRKGQTDAEQRLWYFLRAHRFMALKFKRQKPIGPFIADFVCLELKLIIEVDGGQHGSPADAGRDRWFADRGYTVLRFWNNEVLGQTEAVLERIRQVALTLSPNPRPGPIGGDRAQRVARTSGPQARPFAPQAGEGSKSEATVDSHLTLGG